MSRTWVISSSKFSGTGSGSRARSGEGGDDLEDVESVVEGGRWAWKRMEGIGDLCKPGCFTHRFDGDGLG